MPQVLIGRMPELFSEPDKFSPERWSKENKDSLPSMFAHLPFGFGARMCVGKFWTIYRTSLKETLSNNTPGHFSHIALYIN